MAKTREIKIGHEREFLLLSDFYEGESTRSSKGELWSVHVHIALSNLRADARVWLNDVLDPPLVGFFHDLAESWRGWDGVREWRAYEDGLALSCTHDGLGHVTTTVELRPLSAAGWLVRGDVPLDAGQLEQIAYELDRFMSEV